MNARKELMASISIEPWYTTLTSELSKALIICVENGMPTYVANNIISNALKDSISYAISVETSSHQSDKIIVRDETNIDKIATELEKKLRQANIS